LWTITILNSDTQQEDYYNAGKYSYVTEKLSEAIAKQKKNSVGFAIQ
jgi:hypothetical protein